MNNNFHIFRQNKRLKIQNNFAFVDTESYSKMENDLEILSFKLGCSIFWKRKENIIDKLTFYNINDFWNKLESKFDKENKDLILFAHNTQFDIKLLNGFNELFKRNWLLVSFYVKNRVFILVFKKKINSKITYTLHIWDTMNYVNKSLKQLGKNINLRKLEINFKKVSNKVLEIYCKRDTFIIFIFIKKLINFLLKNDLSRLKATSGSLSLNAFRHKFYNPNNEKEKIYIHDWKKAIELERNSYKGGITDCFKLGYNKNIYKLDINSQYPYVMSKFKFPNKLLFYSHESKFNQKQLFDIYNKFKKKYGIILNCTIYIPKNNAYILNKFNNKSMFNYGIFNICLCTPELNFVEKYGKILSIHEISIYQLYPLFKKFINFFYTERLKNKKVNNTIYIEFIKLIMNTLYGKFGQKEIIIKELKITDKFIKRNHKIILLMIKEKRKLIINNSIVYLGKIINESEIYFINGKLFRIKYLNINSKDSFVAISSFITSYSRMLLIKYLKIAKRKNVVYCDTDSLFTNKIGYNNLKNAKLINDYKLGFLKKENFGNCNIYCPKFYDFNDTRKIKGIKLITSNLLKETSNFAKYEVYLWNKFKSDLRNGILNKQIITKTTKEVKKLYDKGNINQYGYITPYHILQI